MKLSNISIKRNLDRKLRLTKNRVRRARYYRGHGVHSPYIYGIVRFVFMTRKLSEPSKPLYNRLLAIGVNQKRAVQLHNLCNYCNYTNPTIDSTEGDMCIATQTASNEQLISMVESAAVRGTTIVVMDPYADATRESLCRDIIANHKSTTVDNRAYILIFNNHLPKQHFVI